MGPRDIQDNRIGRSVLVVAPECELANATTIKNAVSQHGRS